MHFPVLLSLGKYIPFLDRIMGRNFPLERLWESVSHFDRPEWDALSAKQGLRTKSWTVEVRNGVRMAYSRRMVERARALRGAGLTVMEITEILGGPGKTSVWRWIRDVRKPAGRAGGGMDLPRLVGDGPDYPDIDPEDKDALIERLRLENAVLRAVQDVLKAESLDGMSNREKTLVIDRLRPAGKWSLRELTGFLRISRSSYDYQRRAIARPDRLAPLRDVVRRVFLEDGDGARGYRFVVRRLRELDDPCASPRRSSGASCARRGSSRGG